MDRFEKDFDEALKTDPIQEAQKILNLRWDEDDAVIALALLNTQDLAEKKKAFALLAFDTHFSSPLEEYIKVIEDIGFKRVYYKPFEAVHCGSLMKSEHFIYWLKEKGILLNFDTYYGNHVNGGKFYYNIRLNDNYDPSCLSSHGPTVDPDVRAGDHDCREAIRHHINKLSENGQFLAKWIERPFLWLLNWSDTLDKNYDYKAVNEARIKELPLEVQEAITP